MRSHSTKCDRQRLTQPQLYWGFSSEGGNGPEVRRELGIGRKSVQPAVFDPAKPNLCIERCQRHWCSSNSVPSKTGSGRNLGDTPLDFGPAFPTPP